MSTEDWRMRKVSLEYVKVKCEKCNKQYGKLVPAIAGVWDLRNGIVLCRPCWLDAGSGDLEGKTKMSKLYIKLRGREAYKELVAAIKQREK